MIIKAFITHKQAELFADCQDRFGVNPDTKSISVSDGMGSTWQQKIWAQLLVEAYTQSDTWVPSIESIKPLCSSWQSQVEAFIQHLKDTNAPLNMVYRNERNLAEGRSAGATFVGIRFNGYKWTSTVLGDSCLIEWNGTEAKFHTSQDVEAFDSYPDYFDSDASKEGKGTPKDINGVISVGKFLFLVSDPFSEFLLEHSKQGNIGQYIEELLALTSHDGFEALVNDWRKEGMHNDDTTLVIVEYDNSKVLTINHEDNIVKMVEEERVIQESNKKTIEVGSIGTPNAPSAMRQAIDKQGENPISEDPRNDSHDFVNADTIVEEFLVEYQKALAGRCQRKPKRDVKKFLGKLQYKTTQDAAKDALNTILNKYVIYVK